MNNIKGKIWLFGDDINTDLMYPQVCYTLPESEKPSYAMRANRPEWAEMVSPGDIIVAGRNFGTGSSRPAADNIKNLGIACVLAESINGLFLRNAVNSGFLSLEAKNISSSVREGDTITVNMEKNVIESQNLILPFRPLPPFLMDIIENGGIINILKKRGMLGDPL
ncbi:MAG: 3-isopropylmalate dehydratase [Ferroplasma sp.]